MMTLVLSLVGPIIAVAVWWVGWQQMQIARVKLYHDLYDRRYRLFNAVRDLISEIFKEGSTSTKSLRAYSLATADAPFLLDDELSRYINEIRTRVFHLRDIERKEANTPPGSDIDAMSRESDEVFDWLDKQREVLTEKFRPFLQLPEIRTVPFWMERLSRRIWPRRGGHV